VNYATARIAAVEHGGRYEQPAQGFGLRVDLGPEGRLDDRQERRIGHALRPQWSTRRAKRRRSPPWRRPSLRRPSVTRCSPPRSASAREPRPLDRGADRLPRVIGRLDRPGDAEHVGRRRLITAGTGQAMEYQESQAQAFAALATPEPATAER
jgi:hypothetical protein